jgi:hypothetical protein
MDGPESDEQAQQWCEREIGGVWTDAGCESKTNEGVEERRRGTCLNWELRDALVQLAPVETQPDMYSVRIDGYSTGLYLRRMQRNGETVYMPREIPDLGVYRDPIEAVRGALGVAFRLYIGDSD